MTSSIESEALDELEIRRHVPKSGIPRAGNGESQVAAACSVFAYEDHARATNVRDYVQAGAVEVNRCGTEAALRLRYPGGRFAQPASTVSLGFA